MEFGKKSIYNDIVNKNAIICKHCRNIQNSPYKLLSEEQIKKRIEDANIKIEKFEYKGINTIVKSFCLKCNKPFNTEIRYLYHRGSKLCNRCKHSSSTTENEIKDFIISKGFIIQE